MSGPDSATSTAALSAFISWSHTSDAAREATGQVEAAAADARWRDQIAALVVALRDRGIDADADLFHLHERGIDWTRYGPNAVDQADVVLAVVNAAWRDAWSDKGDGTRGRGAAAEIDVLRSLFNDDRDTFQRRLVVVNLPGTTVRRPLGLDRVPRVAVPSFDDHGMSDLIRMLSEQPEYRLPPLGSIPALPARLPSSAAAPRSERSASPRSMSRGEERGSGDAVVDLPLPDGPGALLVVDGNQTGRHFAIKPTDGGRSLVNTTEPYRGTTYLEVPAGVRAIRLQVKAAGAWSVEARPTSVAELLNDGEARQGLGDAVLIYQGLGGVARITGNAEARHFAVRATPAGGGRSRTIVNTTEPYEGSVMCPPGPALLVISAVGDWMVSVS